MPALSEVAREKLQALAAAQRRRELTESAREDGITLMRGGRRLISFSCNDYLGLSHHPKVKAASVAAIEQYGCGAGASRLVTGNHPLYAELEARLAAWKGMEAALACGSGYLANIAIVPALVGKGDLILADKLVHACLIDGAALSHAKFIRFRHNDTNDLEKQLGRFRSQFANCLILTEDVFSMDGDVAPVAEISAIAKAHDTWLMVDGAHGIIPSHAPVDIAMGTLSKALGGYGGYVCAKKDIIEYLANSMRSFVFSTGLPPAVIASAIASLDVIKNDPALLHKPLAKAQLFTDALGLPKAQSQIVPLVLGEEASALAAAKTLEDAGFLAVAIRPPTVPANTARLRLTFSALHADSDILRLVQTIKDNLM